MTQEIRIIWLLAIGLSLSCLLGYIAQKAKQPPIIGYLMAGYLIGPNFPGFVADAYISDQLAGIGVTLLMFTVGLGFNWKDLIAVRRIALPGALILSTLSIAAGALYSVYLGECLLQGFAIGLAICVSSTVVIVRVLGDQGWLNTRQGHIVVGWTLVEDLISVLGLLLLPALVVSNVSADAHRTGIFDLLYPISWVFFKIAILGLCVYLFGEKLIEVFLRRVARTKSHELFSLAILSCAFLIAAGSSYLFGVSLALGAFIAGTIVGKTDMSHQAAAHAAPMRDVFAVIFFLSVGMLFNPLAVGNNLPLFFGILIILIVLRPLFAFLIMTIARYPKGVALTVALAIAQIGEYSFILAEEGSQLGILPDNTYDLLVASSFITIGLNPLLFKLATWVKKKSPDSSSEPFFIAPKPEDEQKGPSFLPRVIIVGFGSMGQEVSQYLSERGYHVLVIERNADTFSAPRGGEVQKLLGNAARVPILAKARIGEAQLLVITIEDFSVTQSIIREARHINPFIQIIARSRFKSDLTNGDLEDIATICDEEASSEKLISIIQTQLKHR